MKTQAFDIHIVVTDEKATALVYHTDFGTYVRTPQMVEAVGSTSLHDLLSALAKEIHRSVEEAGRE
jgi:hypothetical protein